MLPAATKKPTVLLADEAVIMNALAYQHRELVARLRKKLKLDTAQATVLFTDVKMYLYLCATTRKALAPTPSIDAGWHEFLMYTRDYARFCADTLGAFVHHTPTPTFRPHLVSDPQDTIDLAQQVFGALSSNWTLGQRIAAKTSESSDISGAVECSPDHDCHGDGSCGGDV